MMSQLLDDLEESVENADDAKHGEHSVEDVHDSLLDGRCDCICRYTPRFLRENLTLG